MCADATQILDQGQSQHDRNCPQLSELKGTDSLVSRDETAETFGVDPAVAV